MAGFDVEGARAAGYSEAEIVDHLAQSRSFDAAAARKSGYSDAELLSHLRAPLAPAGPDPNAPTALGSAARGVVRGATLGFADELRAGTDALAQGASNLFGGNGPSMGEAYDRSLAASRQQDRLDHASNPVASTVGEVVGGAGGAIGGGAVVAPLRVGQALARLNPLARAAIGGAGIGGASGFGAAEGGAANRLSEGVVGAGVGAGVGGAAGVIGGVLGRVISPVRPNLSAEQQALIDAARREGIPLSAGQETGSRTLKTLESQLAQLPGSSAIEANAQEAQRRAFNRAVLSRSGTEADIASPEVLNEARSRIGGQIGDIANRNTLRVTPALEARLGQIEDDLRFIPGESSPDGHMMHPGPVGARIAKLREMMQSDTTSGEGLFIPGMAYRRMDSDLGRAIRNSSDGDRRASLTELRDLLRQSMDDSIGPDDAAAWQQARREYANLMVAAKAAGGAGGSTAEGNISPLALRGAVDQSTGGGYVWGRGDLNELARVGQSVLRQPPDSGTAGRSLMNSLLTGSAPVAGGMAGLAAAGPIGAAAGIAAPFVIPSAVQSFLNSRAGRAYLTNQLAAGLEVGGRAGGALGGMTERNRLLND